MIVGKYFRIQKLTFAAVGIDPTVTNSKHAVQRPLLCYFLIAATFVHLILIVHFVITHFTHYEEVADSFPLLCQAILTLWKMGIFLGKKRDILQLITEINQLNMEADINGRKENVDTLKLLFAYIKQAVFIAYLCTKNEELAIVQKENSNDSLVSTIYYRIVLVTGTFSFTHPVIYGLYVYLTTGKVVFVEANKASYFWDYSHIGGYSLVFLLNFLTCYYVCDVSLAIDTLFNWFARNILAQYQILIRRFQQIAVKHNTMTYTAIASCVQYHLQTLSLAERLNQDYGEIIFIKFTIVCTEICSLVFRLSRPNDSMFDVVYKVLFLCAVALQLSLYCYNGQRLKDESMQVSVEIYTAFDWSHLNRTYEKLLLMPMKRSQKPSHLKGVFFEVDLSLYLWVFKTAGSLITALKTLEEKQI